MSTLLHCFLHLLVPDMLASLLGYDHELEGNMRHEAGEVTTDVTTPPPDGPSQYSCLACYQSLGSWPIVMNGPYSVCMQISNMLCSKSNSFSLIDWINQAASNCTLQSKVLCKQD